LEYGSAHCSVQSSDRCVLHCCLTGAPLTTTLPEGIFVASPCTFTIEEHRRIIPCSLCYLLSVARVQLTLTRKPSLQKSMRRRDPTPGPRLEASRQFQRQFLNKSLVQDQDILCLSVISHFHPVLTDKIDMGTLHKKCKTDTETLNKNVT
jgi:hypothetical protein